jgi:hypothetical protein
MGRGGRGLDPEKALEISIDGTARRLAADNIPTLDAINQLRELAGGRVDVLARAAGSAVGAYLGHPLTSALNLKAAYLLVLAADGNEHAALVAAADDARKAIGGSAYSL